MRTPSQGSGPQSDPSPDREPNSGSAPSGSSALPLIRHLSIRLTPLLYRTPLTPNQITLLSLLFGVGSWLAIGYGTSFWQIVGALALIACYVLDNCDGEIARLKDLSSKFGAHFDTFVDWIVHAGFFLALGFGTYRATLDEWWLWLGAAAAVGGTINYFLGLALDYFRPKPRETEESPESRPETWRQWLLFAFRELMRADFCFIVLVLALADLAWVLLPAGAIGAQVYWITQLVQGARDYHV